MENGGATPGSGRLGDAMGPGTRREGPGGTGTQSVGLVHQGHHLNNYTVELGIRQLCFQDCMLDFPQRERNRLQTRAT